MAINIPIRDIPGPVGVPTTTTQIAMDNGTAMQRTTALALVNGATPVATEAEAIAGANNSKRMTALRTKQAIESIGDARFASAAQGALADTAVQAADLGTLATKDTVDNSDFSGTGLSIANGGTGASTAEDARTNLGLGTAATTDATDYATAAQGALAETALQSAGPNLVPPGGTTGQVLAKSDDDDFELTWTNAGSGDVRAVNNLSDLASPGTARTNLGLGTAAVANLLDEDNFASDSASAVPSQQSTKAYIASQMAKASDNYDSIAAAQAATVPPNRKFLYIAGGVHQRIAADHPRLGQQLVSNRGFAVSTGWTLGANFTITGGVLRSSAGSVAKGWGDTHDPNARPL